MTDRGGGPLLQLTLWRLRELWREPEAIFGVFAFPILLALALGILPVATSLPYASGLVARRDFPMILLVASAGAADGMAAFVAKIVAQDATAGALLAVVGWAALVAAVVWMPGRFSRFAGFVSGLRDRLGRWRWVLVLITLGFPVVLLQYSPWGLVLR